MYWKSTGLEELQAIIDEDCADLTAAERRLWQVIQIPPMKWRQDPYGNQGGGFWGVAVFGGWVVWYNDIEDGFNFSPFTEYGEIGLYGANQDPLGMVVRKLREYIETGEGLWHRIDPPGPSE